MKFDRSAIYDPDAPLPVEERAALTEVVDLAERMADSIDEGPFMPRLAALAVLLACVIEEAPQPRPGEIERMKALAVTITMHCVHGMATARRRADTRIVRPC